MEKRGPILADRVAAGFRSMWDRRLDERLRQRIRNARRFVLDEAAAIRLGEVIRDVPDLIVKHSEFARQPFDLMWVELPHPPLFQTVTGRASDSTADTEVAYLYDHGTVYSFVGGSRDRPNRQPGVVPAVYHLHEPWALADQLAFVDRFSVSRIHLDGFLWGESFHKLDDATKRQLRAQHSCEIILRKEFENHGPERFEALLNGSSGDLRNMVAILLLLNRPRLTRFVQEMPAGRGWVRNKPAPFLSHTTVTIDLDARPALRRIGTDEGDAEPRRRHEVRGHYCHNQTYKSASRLGCPHNLVRDDEATHPEDSWKCTLCGGKRWWRAHHERGDAGKGFVIQTWNVAG